MPRQKKNKFQIGDIIRITDLFNGLYHCRLIIGETESTFILYSLDESSIFELFKEYVFKRYEKVA
jgi:hypothetical protein